NHLIALADFGGTLRITQNFTADADRLKKVVAGIKFSSVSPNAQAPVEVASSGMPSLMNAEAEFGRRSMLLAVRDLAKGLATVPGRKSLVLLTSGFPLTREMQSELSATIDACNKANVAVYPIDVRGLVAPGAGPASGPHARMRSPTTSQSGHLRAAIFRSGSAEPAPRLLLVHGPPTPPSPPHPPSPPPSPPHTPAPTPPRNNNPNPQPQPQPSVIVPKFPESASTNQQMLYELADGTGGFVIVNTNDLLGGMERIGKEQGEYYILGYTPPDSPDRSCHVLQVKVG